MEEIGRSTNFPRKNGHCTTMFVHSLAMSSKVQWRMNNHNCRNTTYPCQFFKRLYFPRCEECQLINKEHEKQGYKDSNLNLSYSISNMVALHLYSSWISLYFNKTLQWGPPLLYFRFKKKVALHIHDSSGGQASQSQQELQWYCNQSICSIQ